MLENIGLKDIIAWVVMLSSWIASSKIHNHRINSHDARITKLEKEKENQLKAVTDVIETKINHVSDGVMELDGKLSTLDKEIRILIGSEIDTLKTKNEKQYNDINVLINTKTSTIFTKIDGLRNNIDVVRQDIIELKIKLNYLENDVNDLTKHLPEHTNSINLTEEKIINLKDNILRLEKSYQELSSVIKNINSL